MGEVLRPCSSLSSASRACRSRCTAQWSRVNQAAGPARQTTSKDASQAEEPISPVSWPSSRTEDQGAGDPVGSRSMASGTGSSATASPASRRNSDQASSSGFPGHQRVAVKTPSRQTSPA